MIAPPRDLPSLTLMIEALDTMLEPPS